MADRVFRQGDSVDSGRDVVQRELRLSYAAVIEIVTKGDLQSFAANAAYQYDCGRSQVPQRDASYT